MATQRETLDTLIDLFTPVIRDAFIAAIQDITDSALLAQVIEAIEIGDVEAAFRALGYSEAAMRPLTASIERAFETGGVFTGRTFPKYLNTASGRGVFRFDVRNSRAEAWLRNNSSELITRIGDETRVSIRNQLTRGMEEGRNPRNVALDIIGRYDPMSGHRVGGVVGLSAQGETWARSARQRLIDLDPQYFNMELRDKRFDRTVEAAIRDGKPLTVETIDKLTLRYKDNALKYRGDMIGRTEAIASLNRSEWEATMQAVDLGATSADAVKRIWDDVGDRRTRPTHRMMNGQERGLDEPFIAPGGDLMMHPGDTTLGARGKETIFCRCRVKTVIDWAAGIS